MKSNYIYIVLVVVIIVGFVLLRNVSSTERIERVTAFDGFAQCLSDAGATFYGAYWCPHCQDQKRMFDNSRKIPYVECSTPNGQAQLPVCIDAGVESYPTWDFADGTRLNGVQSLEELGSLTNCELPNA